VKCTV